MLFVNLIKSIGVSKVARNWGVSRQAVHNMIRRRRLPFSEWTGTSQYAAILSCLVKDKIDEKTEKNDTEIKLIYYTKEEILSITLQEMKEHKLI